MKVKNTFDFAYQFKSHCTSINERSSKLEGFLHSIYKNKMKTFPPFGNEFLPPSKNISLTDCPIMHPMKHKDLCGYDIICIMSSGLMFDNIIMNIINNKKLARHNEENDFLFTNIENNIIYMYMGSLQDFYWGKGTHESLDVLCPHFNVEIIKMR